MRLDWYDASNDEPQDENSDTGLFEHGYWSLGPTGDGMYGLELIQLDDDAEHEEVTALGLFHDKGIAKEAAQAYENEHAPKTGGYVFIYSIESRARASNGYHVTMEIQRRSDEPSPELCPPKASDLPEDFRHALRLWLDNT